MKLSKHSLSFLLSGSLVLATAQGGCATEADQSAAQPAQAAPQPSQEKAQTAQESPQELDQVVAPIALYPDSLVAQILAASTYPSEVVEADRWMQQHSALKGDALAQAVNQQSWDPSVKALTQFPSVLANMDKNLSWTSALGDAYANQPQAVLDAVQVMRRRAQQAGTLKSTSQQTVTTEGQTIAIQPASPDVVYVPEYDPWLVYGAPVGVYPGWVQVPGVYAAEPEVSFGLGIGIGLFAGFAWGFGHWGADWHGHTVVYNHNTYISHSRSFYGANRGNFHPGHADFARARADFAHAGGFHGGAPHGRLGVHSSAFSGFDHGGVARANSSRGQASFGGFHGGGFHGGGSHGGGHR